MVAAWKASSNLLANRYHVVSFTWARALAIYLIETYRGSFILAILPALIFHRSFLTISMETYTSVHSHINSSKTYKSPEKDWNQKPLCFIKNKSNWCQYWKTVPKFCNDFIRLAGKNIWQTVIFSKQAHLYVRWRVPIYRYMEQNKTQFSWACLMMLVQAVIMVKC